MLQSTADFNRSQSRISAAAIVAARRFWSRMGPSFDASWAAIEAPITVLTSSAQLAAATAGAAYVPAALEEQSIVPALTGTFNPSQLVGVASDGRPLGNLLYESVIKAKEAVGTGATVRESLQFGGSFLDMVIDGMVQDSGRVASGVQIVQSQSATGWVREEKSGCCSRCAVLQGKFYRWSNGFERHPHCHGVHIPTDSPDFARAYGKSPRSEFESLDGEAQDRIYGKANAQAIRDGADVSQVVNARRGMSTAGRTTTEGTTRRGSAAKYLQGRQRLMPEEIYRIAGGDREAAIKALYANGYLT